MKRALVTGAKGFIGKSLVGRLIAENWIVGEVVGSRTSASSSPIDFHLGQGRPEDFELLLEDYAPDVIFHMAGRTNSSDLADLYGCNVALAANLFRAVRRREKYPVVVLAGSAAEYGPVGREALPVTEDLPCRPITDYGISKYAQTLIGLASAEAGIPVIVARIFNPVGPGMPEHLALGSFAAQLRAAGDHIDLRTGNLNVERDFIDVDEATRLIVMLASLSQSYGRVYNICSGRAFHLRALLNQLIKASGRATRVFVDPGRVRNNDMPLFVGSTARLEAIGLTVREPDLDVLLPRLLNES